MPPTLTPAAPAPPPDPFRRKRWTRDECRFLTESNVLEAGRYELIEGDIVYKVGQNPPHITVMNLVSRVLFRIFGGEFLQTQAPITLPGDEHNEPEPDAAVLNAPVPDVLRNRKAPPADIRLVVEVADTTLTGDLTVKASLYARFGIGEYWVIDIPGRRIVVHRQPAENGYGSVTAHGEEESIAPLTAPNAPVRVADLLP